ncbi:Protein CBG05208 [Caenorhabditis briggsae]|uniref:Protein CBG05208 n=1 Tax=Caenorhabditis briggsae TaxID=6238 RepID=A8WZE0_CAEBR|nr:Protein CBG05208 [Caenorhabditis briggsae]CAP25750.2 Protein CBG05208 [Caenorhabditis briggsae]
MYSPDMVHPFETDSGRKVRKFDVFFPYCYIVQSKNEVHSGGMGWPKASLFLIGHSAGAGMLAMPMAFSVMGVEIGTLLTIVCAGFSLNTGLQLGWMWLMLQEIWPEYRKLCQNPYGAIALRSYGPIARHAIEIMVCFSELGYTVVLLLLAAKNASVLFHFFLAMDISQCYLIVIVAVLVWPSIMLRSPENFWQIAWISTASSWAAVVLIVIGVIQDAPVCSKDVPHEPASVFKAFMSYGSMVFAYAAHPSFPTCQHDMKHPSQFSYSLMLTWGIISVYYMVVSYLGYFVYGSSIGDSIISSIQNTTFQQLINLMFAIHVASTIVIASSPAFQITLVFFLVTLTALTFPHFGPMINLLGASVNSLIAMILPSAFYLSLRAFREKWKLNKKRTELPSFKEIFQTTPKHILIFNIVSMTFGLLAAIISTISAIRTFLDSSLPPPCYIQYFQSGLSFSAPNGTIGCCGTYRNLTSELDPNGFCSFRNFKKIKETRCSVCSPMT